MSENSSGELKTFRELTVEARTAIDTFQNALLDLETSSREIHSRLGRNNGSEPRTLEDHNNLYDVSVKLNEILRGAYQIEF